MLNKLRSRRGFTLIELLIVVAIVCIFVIGFEVVGGIVCGNFWFSGPKVLNVIQGKDPDFVKVQSIEKHIWGYSNVTAIKGNGEERVFLVDTDILQNVRLYEVPEGQ